MSERHSLTRDAILCAVCRTLRAVALGRQNLLLCLPSSGLSQEIRRNATQGPRYG